MSIKSQNISFVNVVSKLINDKGLEVIQKPSLLEAYLNDLIPNNSSEIFLINISLKEDIASIIFNDKIDFETKNLQLAKKLHTLTNEYYLSCDGATKVIELWKSIYKETNYAKESVTQSNIGNEVIQPKQENAKLHLGNDLKNNSHLANQMSNENENLSSSIIDIHNHKPSESSCSNCYDQKKNLTKDSNQMNSESWLDVVFIFIIIALLMLIFIFTP